MGICWSWLRELICHFVEAHLVILMWAVSGALVMLYNFHSTFCLIERFRKCALNEEQENTDMDTDEYNDDDDAAEPTPALDYGAQNGPHAWQTALNNQSPINIDTQDAEQICMGLSLMWVGYDELPVGIRLENNGHTLLLRACFAGDTPFVDGADLLCSFAFHEISFRWSWHENATGSEHSLNNEHFPLEMQCLHTSSNEGDEVSSRSLLVISYMFDIAAENPFLDVIVQYLVAVQRAGQCVEIPPFPLNYLMPAFYTDFYSYHGSLTEPPCHRGAEWFINPLPLAISERQLHEFRKLRSRSGSRISRNARPVQELGNRTVSFNCYNPLDE
ncbi:PREDICTED: putative carbonic anhydrase 3 [Drosophila arizonae]|uniref:Carbonic anhydrase 3 n=1 Tax=Drosophila arizonae TaxID=7263 RepID=A0ABM1PMB0_DROAR|nr:PREDICTED: putative carbonic anhydrase 3 [Drosophila arizonae]